MTFRFHRCLCRDEIFKTRPHVDMFRELFFEIPNCHIFLDLLVVLFATYLPKKLTLLPFFLDVNHVPHVFILQHTAPCARRICRWHHKIMHCMQSVTRKIRRKSVTHKTCVGRPYSLAKCIWLVLVLLVVVSNCIVANFTKT